MAAVALSNMGPGCYGDDDDDTIPTDDDDDTVADADIAGDWSVVYRCVTDEVLCEEETGTITFTVSGASASMEFGDLSGPVSASRDVVTYTDLTSSDEGYKESGLFVIHGDSMTYSSTYFWDIEAGSTGQCKGNGVRAGTGTPSLGTLVCDPVNAR